ncbi:GNAT family N-acetyltransferase [Elizabethkingia ursingii]|uniref:GNAT family N-acetyltransferase n=1 Tax=Elizabethkingia ursingii TaxID=1756150 RepID=UPI002011E24E|nr:GNAT family N-acetyltransferase [Elizabethkingia ursingii]MCL1669872.1 GNAT family N-acetyltransferase [Elizabethkingia ursingii]
MTNNFLIRKATEKDTPVIFSLIKQLAEYEKLSDAVITSEEELRHNIFYEGLSKVLIAEENNIPIGFALYFYNFSTFVGKAGLYLEDLFVEPAHRGKGYGKKLLVALAQIAKEKSCGRMEWSVLNWNKPSIEFYESLEAVPMNEWTVYRLTQDKIDILANS